MESITRSKAAAMLRSRSRAMHALLAFACVALVVAIGVFISLRQQGVAMAHEVTVLDCHHSGNAAHTHNADCYDADGNLVCPLPELELHTHDDSCYTETRTLVCGLEEDENHSHTDECYEVTRTLTCGKEEVTEEHVHGPACFKTVVTQDDQAPAADQDHAEDRVLTADLREADERGTEQVILTASVKAPAGALPEDATLRVSHLDESDEAEALTKVEAALRREFGSNAAVKQAFFVNVQLTDASSQDVTPANEVQVKLTTRLISEVREANADNLVLVRLPGPNDPSTDEATVIQDATLVNWDEHDTSKGHEDALQFVTDEELAPYALVELTKKAEATEGPVAPADGEQPAASASAAEEYTATEPEPE
ncbi:MAG: hypothetical protein IJ781_07960, partial [Atopobiaceae bacterium]|nr:hypothetical protein [Atopobiaceae bacterium]